jgi:hypothetical protein
MKVETKAEEIVYRNTLAQIVNNREMLTIVTLMITSKEIRLSAILNHRS